MEFQNLWIKWQVSHSESTAADAATFQLAVRRHLTTPTDNCTDPIEIPRAVFPQCYICHKTMSRRFEDDEARTVCFDCAFYVNDNSSSMPFPLPQSIVTQERMSTDSDTIPRGLPLHTPVTSLEDVGSCQPDVDDSDQPPSLASGHLTSQLKEHAGLELALIAVLATVTLNVICSDTEGRVQACHALVVLRPIFLLFHFGAALTTCTILFIQPKGGNPRCLRFFWTVFFGLGLFCIIIQVSLYAWTVGSLITRVITVLLAVLCSLPGFYLVGLKWKSPNLERKDIEA